MADVSIANTLITALNTDQVLTKNAATSTVIDETQDFIYTPTGKDEKIAILIEVADSHGAVAFSIAGGDGVFGTVAKTSSVAQATTDVIQIETGRYMQTGGTIVITFTPASGKRLLTDHALKVSVIELR